MRLIGLTGKAGSGKSYIAREVLAKRAGYIPLSLAGPMKAALAARGAIPAEEATGQIDKSDRTRRILQVYGTELGRDLYHEDVWVSEIEWWLAWFIQEAGIDNFVITDIRYPNEAEWVESLGGIVIRVTGRGGLPGSAADHPSETALDDHDFPTLDNSSDANTPVMAQELRRIIHKHYS